MKRKIIYVLSASAVAVLMAAAPALAHTVGPCDDQTGPGHSGYAEHHIVPLAKDGELGQGHKPGTHKGFSTCL